MSDPASKLEIFPVAIGEYADPAHQRLEVEAEVAEIVRLLDEFGGELTPWHLPMADRHGDKVNERLTQWAKSDLPCTLLYWVGHGWSDGRQATLAHAGSPGQVGQQGMTAALLTEFLAARESEAGPEAWVIVVVDTCQSAKFVQLLDSEVNTRLLQRRLLLVGVSSRGATRLGRFSATLRAILTGTFRAEETISLWDLTAELRRVLPDHGEVIPKQIANAVLRRSRKPVVLGAPVDVSTEIENVLEDLTDDERRHFFPKAQGAELGEQAWYFEGRKAESEAVARWLHQAAAGMLVVTGPAGSGKSALLGHLIVQSRPVVRQLLSRHGLLTELPEPARPPDDAFDVVVHLTGMSALEVVNRLAAETAHVESLAEAGLNDAIRILTKSIQDRSLTIVVDALDEALDPLTIADTVLRRLVELPRVRVVVGTRRSTREGPDQPSPADQDIVDALGGPAVPSVAVHRDGLAIGRYVRRRLETAQTQGRLDVPADAVHEAALVIGTSDRGFLFARLAVHELLADPSHLTQEGLLQLTAGDHRTLFGMAVERLSRVDSRYEVLLRSLAYARGRGVPIRDGVWASLANSLGPAASEIREEVIEALMRDAAPYVTFDREFDQTVYRLAHRTFAEHFFSEVEPTPENRIDHHHIVVALVEHVTRDRPEPVNPYITRYLSAHAALGGQASWSSLDGEPGVVDALDPRAVAADAMRSAFGYFPLPPVIAGVIGASHLLAGARRTERRLLRQLAMTRHTDRRAPAAEAPVPGVPSVIWTSFDSSPTHRTLARDDDHTFKALAVVSWADGRVLVAVPHADDAIRLWDPTTGSTVGNPLSGQLSQVLGLCAVPLPDGRVLLAAGSSEGIRVWNVLTGEQLYEPLTDHANAVRALAPVALDDGRVLLASGGDDGTVRLWDPTTGASLGVLERHISWARSLATVRLAGGERLLVSGGSDHAIRLWSAARCEPIGPLHGSTSWNRAVVAVPHPDGNVLVASGSGDGVIRLWDVESRQEVCHPMVGHTSWVRTLATVGLGDGRVLIASGSRDGTARLWNPEDGKPVGDVTVDHSGGVEALASIHSPDGRGLVASGGADGVVRLWDPSAWAATRSPGRRGAAVTALIAFPVFGGGIALYSADRRGGIRAWDAATGEILWEVPDAHPSTDDKTFRPTRGATVLLPLELPGEPRVLVSGGSDGWLRFWSPSGGELLREMPTGVGLGIASLAVVQADGRTPLLAVHKAMAGVQIVDPTGAEPSQLLHAGSFSRTLAALPGKSGAGKVLAGADSDGLIMWDPYDRTEINRFKPAGYWTRTLTTLALSDGRTLLAGGSANGYVWIGEAENGRGSDEPLGSHARGYNPDTGHVEGVLSSASMTLSDGRLRLVTGGRDGTVRLWDPIRRHETRSIEVGVGVSALCPLPDDRLALGTPDGVVMIALGPEPEPVDS
ncbi:nSTAND1 domain-containing NTPase [Amycolatopsis sp. NPDC005003]